MKHKVGDKVKIRTDLIPDVGYGKGVFREQMIEFLGTEQIVECFLEDDNEEPIAYCIGEWCWVDEMLDEKPLSKKQNDKQAKSYANVGLVLRFDETPIGEQPEQGNQRNFKWVEMNGQGEQPRRKYPLTAEQQRVADTLADYERAYIVTNQKEGNYLVLNGDKTERVRSNTLTALIKKGYLGANGKDRLKLI